MAAFTQFYAWLEKHKSLRTPVGELAREVLKDQNFPQNLTTLEGFLEHIRSAPYASSEVLAKARATWRAFERGR